MEVPITHQKPLTQFYGPRLSQLKLESAYLKASVLTKQTYLFC